MCQRTRAKVDAIGDAFGVAARYTKYADLLRDPEVEAVHINTPIPDHAGMTIDALKAGKHVACTVPMATTVEDLRAIVSAVRSSGKNYMMMETAVYTREFLFVRDMVGRGELGAIQFLRGAHYQDMENWPGYWMGRW